MQADEGDNDADKVWSAFVGGCIAGGPEGCPSFSPTAAEISENVETLYVYASFRDRPIPVRTNVSFGLVDYSMLRRAILRSLYFPYATFPVLTQALADLYAGNATALFKISEQPPFECVCDASEYQFESVGEAGFGVLCNDAKQISRTYEDTVAHYQQMPSIWADVWEMGWPEFPKNYFRDSVAPLWSTHKMAQGFNGCIVLTQDSTGHCSVSGPSICTQKHILEGILPDPGNICPVIGTPFPANEFQTLVDPDTQAVLSLATADHSLFQTVRELATTSHLHFLAPL
ncbi:hypothetical protein FB451DRAFT_1385359 [Mycena latifolia]|nr:hypothetical protein FB451DRAFT_1385359 [Mycena latifolia]